MTSTPSKCPKAQACTPRLPLAALALIGLLTSGPGRAVASPKSWTPTAQNLSGVWIGEHRDRPDKGSWRRQRVALQLKAYDKTRRLTGRLGLQVGIGRAFGGLLSCNKKAQARVGRGAELAAGRFNKAGFRFRLNPLKLTGEAACGIHAPVARTCDGRPAAPGVLDLSCGPLKLRLRKASLEGVWGADVVRTDRSGDGVERHLRLHLRHNGERISALLDQIQVQISNDGQKYRCNGRLRFSRQQRYRLAGRRAGLVVGLDRLETISRAGPCQSPGPLIPAQVQIQWDPLGAQLELRFGDAKWTLRRLPGLLPAAGPGRPAGDKGGRS